MFNLATQFAIPGLTVASQVAISLKYPQYGLIIALVAQPFWLYASLKSFRKAGQVGILITSIICTILIIAGIINYWFL